MKSFVGILLFLSSTNIFASEFDFQFGSEASEMPENSQSQQIPDKTEPPAPISPEVPVVVETPSGPTESQLVMAPQDPWRAGFQIDGLGAVSTVDYQEGYSAGLGWSVALQVEKFLTPKLRILGTFGYQSLLVGRFLGSTTTTIDDPFSFYAHKQKGPFIQGMAGIPLMGGYFDFGIQYFHPTSAEQIVGEVGGISNYEFTPTKFLFVVAGPSMTWKVRGEWELDAHAWFFINTVGSSKFKLMGGSLGLALRAPL
jgi:hypothetical protein